MTWVNIPDKAKDAPFGKQSHNKLKNNIVHVHDGLHEVRVEAGGTKGTANLTFTTPSTYRTGKLKVYFNGLLVPARYIVETSTLSFTFTSGIGGETTNWKTNWLGGNNISTDDDIEAVYLLDE